MNGTNSRFLKSRKQQVMIEMSLSGREERVLYKREVSCSSCPILLRASDDQRYLELEYPELCRLLFELQNVRQKEIE